MGCDMHSHVETKGANGWQEVTGIESPFETRSYGVYAFLAGVRNYSAIEPICAPRGLPADVSTSVQEDYEVWGWDAHSASWLLVSKLLAVDYDAEVNDRRVERNGNGGCTGSPEEGERMPLREFLGRGFMSTLDALAALGDPEDTRVVFWLDN